jgi:hypothetical protein
MPLLPAWSVVVSTLGSSPLVFPSLSEWNLALASLKDSAPRSGCGVPLTLVPQGGLRQRRRRRGMGTSNALEENYQARLFLKGEVSTRTENWHDFFNALCCMAYPRTKAVLNARHFWALDERQESLPWPSTLGEKRTSEQDFLTHFDEGGVIVATSDDVLLQSLKERRWHDVFWLHRARLLACMEFFTFGHALFETFLAGHRTQHAMGIAIRVPPSFFSLPLAERLVLADEAAALALENRTRTASPADGFPVPLLGYPGYLAANAEESYYDDKRYFRTPSLASI